MVVAFTRRVVEFNGGFMHKSINERFLVPDVVVFCLGELYYSYMGNFVSFSPEKKNQREQFIARNLWYQDMTV